MLKGTIVGIDRDICDGSVMVTVQLLLPNRVKEIMDKVDNSFGTPERPQLITELDKISDEELHKIRLGDVKIFYNDEIGK